MQFKVKHITLIAMAALILGMIAATVFEKTHGTQEAMHTFYHSGWFIALWAVVSVSGVILLVRRGVPKRFFTMLLHIGLVVILAGALTTHLCGESGEIHLQSGEGPVSRWVLEDGQPKSLPFSLELNHFQIVRYPGSSAPMDYESHLTILDEEKESEHIISMNHILKYRGYRFYQADYDEDLSGSILAVSHDPWGTGLTYTGYLMLLLGMVGFFFEKNSHFRQVLKSLSAACLLLLVSVTAGATPRALPREQADAIGNLYVYYQDRVTTVETLARDYCLKMYGKSHVEGFSASQMLSGQLFFAGSWEDVPLKIKAKDRGTSREQEKYYLRSQLQGGSPLKLFPWCPPDSLRAEMPEMKEVEWYAPSDKPPYEMGEDRLLFVRGALSLLGEQVAREDWEAFDALVSKIRKYQEKTAASVLPPAAKIRGEKLYGRIARPRIPFMVSITLGLVLFILMGIRLSRGKGLKGSRVLTLLALVLWLYLTLVLGLKWYVSGHAPFAGSYNVMMLMAWLSTGAMLLWYRKFPLIQPLGYILAGFTMLMASMSGANPQITHLMPVLNSPLLSVHVLSMMLSYTLFGLVALNGIMGLIVPKEASEKLRNVSLVVLTPAVFLITFGTFLGAVWANISWGTYWAWDPKETWALVTLLIYAMALHSGLVSPLRRPKIFHLYCILAFLAVLITYFGVNLILGGMHAYA